MLELAAAPAPRQVLDGENPVKLFRDPNAKLQRDAIFQHFPGYLGAGADSWRPHAASVANKKTRKGMMMLFIAITSIVRGYSR